MKIALSLGVVALAAFVAGCSSGDSARSAPTTPSIATPVGVSEADASMELCKQAAADQLRDPTTPMFRNVTSNSYHPGEWTVAGEINGKNAFNAYSGYQKFGCIVVTRNGTRTATNVFVL